MLAMISRNNESLSPDKVFGSYTVSRNDKPTPDSMTLEEWMGLDEHIVLQKQAGVSDSTEACRNISFSLSGDAAAYYPLFRSMIAAAPRHFRLMIQNGKGKSFLLKLAAGGESELRRYLSRVLDIVKAEIRFKKILRELIANQERFVLEERLLFNQLSK